MPGSFATYRPAQIRPPLSGPQGETWAGVLGQTQDRELALLRVAALSRFPATCPDDGLDKLGEVYALPRMPGQGNDSYRATLEAAWPTYEIGGSPDAVVASLQAYGFPNVIVFAVWESPGPILPETSATSYSEFYVILETPFGSTGVAPLVLGNWTLGDPGTSVLGSTMTRDQLVAVKRQILRWKAAHGFPIKLLVDFLPGSSPHSPAAYRAMTSYPIGRTLGDTWAPLGDPLCILGGYQI